MIRRPPRSTLFPTRRSSDLYSEQRYDDAFFHNEACRGWVHGARRYRALVQAARRQGLARPPGGDRKSTRLNSSHSQISYAVFCLKKKKYISATLLHQYTCTP